MTLRPLLVSNGLHPRYGGPPHVIVELACQLSRQGLEPEIASLCMAGEEEDTAAAWPELERAGVPVHLFPRATPRVLSRSPEFNSFCSRRIKEFSVVHIHAVWAHSSAFAARCARKAGVPYIVASHGMLDRWSMARSSWKKWLALKYMGIEAMLRHASGIQFGTDDEAKEARALGLGVREFAVPNGFHPSDFAAVRSKNPRELSARIPTIVDRFPVLLFLGRIHPKKGLHLLVEAFASVADEFPNAALLILGIPEDKKYQAQLESRCEQQQIRERVYIISDVVGRRALLAANLAHGFVLPSFQEGFSIALIEALALGLPVLATVPCHMSAIEAVGAGKIVETTTDEIASGLRWILSKEHAELIDLGNRGREWVEAKFTWPAVGQKIEAMYRQVCESRMRAE